MKEPPEVIPSDGVVFGVAADCEIGDRGLAAEGAVEAVVSQVFPGTKVEREPLFIFGSLFPFGYFDKSRLFRVFIGEALKPFGTAPVGQATTEGRSEFGVASSMKATSSCAT